MLPAGEVPMVRSQVDIRPDAIVFAGPAVPSGAQSTAIFAEMVERFRLSYLHAMQAVHCMDGIAMSTTDGERACAQRQATEAFDLCTQAAARAMVLMSAVMRRGEEMRQHG